MDEYRAQLTVLRQLFRGLSSDDQCSAVALLGDTLSDMSSAMNMRRRLVDNGQRTITEEAEWLIQSTYGHPSPWPTSFSNIDDALFEQFGDSIGDELINALYSNLPPNESNNTDNHMRNMPITTTTTNSIIHDNRVDDQQQAQCQSPPTHNISNIINASNNELKCSSSNVESHQSTNNTMSSRRSKSLFTCIECSRKFISKRRRNCHRKVHYTNAIICTLCGYLIANQQRYSMHLIRKHARGDESNCDTDTKDISIDNPNRWSCSCCDYIATNRKQLYRHSTKFNHRQQRNRIKPSAPTTLLNCAHCTYNTRYRQNLGRHTRRCHSIDTIGCEYCGKQFKDRDAIRVHVRYVHENERTSKCRVCDKRFVTASDRTRHMRLIHMQTREHRCNSCGKQFQTACHLKRHSIKCNHDQKVY